MNKELKILLIDNDHSSCAFLRESLLEKGKVDFVSSSDSARKIMSKEKFDIIFLEPLIDNKTGFLFLNDVKNSNLLQGSKVFALTSDKNLQTEILAHQHDVDEYFQKPLEPELLRAAVEKHERILSKGNNTVIRFGSISIDLSALIVTTEMENEKIEVSLTSKEFQILVSLVKNAGAVLTREELYSNIWNKTSNHVQRTLDMHVSSLRKKLGDSGRNIKTIRSLGYMIELDG